MKRSSKCQRLKPPPCLEIIFCFGQTLSFSYILLSLISSLALSLPLWYDWSVF